MPTDRLMPSRSVLPGRGKVLVVDDSSAMRLALESVLSAEHQVFVASNGHEGLAMAVSERPDVILLDVVMAGMDGYAVCSHLKSDPRTEDIPVLFLTSLAGETDETLALESGAIDFLVKPFRPKVVAARVRNHVELKRLRDLIKQQSLIDGLTGIANRRRFDEAIAEAWTACALSQRPLAMILLDVDYFKRYNDRFGHPQGDACLQAVASVLTQCVTSPGSLVARYGGEEFVCVLPEVDPLRAMAVAEHLCAEVKGLGLLHPASEVEEVVTVSLGVASVRPAAGGNPQDLVLRADQQLYRAKSEGRNRACG
jgi:diguanylate cyclase (GGDEF)-like protein